MESNVVKNGMVISIMLMIIAIATHLWFIKYLLWITWLVMIIVMVKTLAKPALRMMRIGKKKYRVFIKIMWVGIAILVFSSILMIQDVPDSTSYPIFLFGFGVFLVGAISTTVFQNKVGRVLTDRFFKRHFDID